jgi:hypothetical protein
MKNINRILIMLAFVGGMTACNDELDVQNPNNQTTYEFGNTESEAWISFSINLSLYPYPRNLYFRAFYES